MQLVLKLAEKGKGAASPNPLVGAIVVKRGQIVGKGYHRKCGEEHAEICAIKQAGKKAKDATLYVNLEPCSHWGKTPPCTEKIAQAGIREVVVGMKDPNPIINGYEELKGRGLKTKIAILESESKKLNEFYIKWMKQKMPFVILKAATSLDGKIATRTGDSKYITGREARKYVHQIRSEVDAIMVGINTVLKDDPKLNVRLADGRDPLIIVLDSKLRISNKSKIIKKPKRLIIATSDKAPRKRVLELEKKGVRVLTIATKAGHIDLKKLMKELGSHEIISVMIEGGTESNASALKAGIVDKVMFFIAPGIIGNGKGAVGDLGIKKVDRRINLKHIKTEKLGKDFLVEGYL